MNRHWWVISTLAATTAALGLLLIRRAVAYVPSLTSELLTNQLTYSYIFVTTAIVCLAVGYVLGRRIENLRRLSSTDSLTGLANRRAFERRLRGEWLRARRYGSPLALLLIDVDGLKAINDRHGHTTGDQVLKTAAGAIAVTMRVTDFGARWGGDEFAIVAPNTTRHSAEHLARRLIGHLSQQVLGDTGTVSISIGVAAIEPKLDRSATTQRLIETADAALYEAKRDGRARIVTGDIRVAEELERRTSPSTRNGVESTRRR